MYFKCSIRNNPLTGKSDGYYRLVESYRNEDDRICHRTILNVGFLPECTVEQLNRIQRHLTDRVRRIQRIFEVEDTWVKEQVESLWERIIREKRVDLKSEEVHRRKVDIQSIEHSNVREVGSEWIGMQTWEKLELGKFLLQTGWSEEQVQLAATQVISRAVYPASELRTSRWIKENSAICELTGYDESKITKDKLYESAKNLYQLKDQLEKHLSHKTNTLFDIQDKILLYDLTNTYFEGTMRGSTLARYGKSKEKRNDAKLVVLALVVNIHGFLKYSSILEGNTADCTTLEQMINKIQNHTSSQKGIVVIDAGIATKENLNYLQQSGYQYVCVNRVNLKNYEAVQGKEQVILQTKNKNEVRIQAISTDISTDYYLRIKSQAKALKESGMKNRFEQRYVEEIQKIAKAVHQKGGVKKISKVYERIGRAKQKYPTAHKLFEIQIETTPSNTLVTNLSWKRITHIEEQVNENLGVYFLRTNLKIDDEKTIWNIYNTIREIESTFRTLKTDLDLRPIFHKTDVASMAHLHLGILAYWLVNTIRHQLKSQGFKNSWQEIVRIANTQKMITTSGTNDQQHIISIRKCSTPEQNLSQIQSILRINSKPFRKRKSVVHKIPPNLFFPSESQHFTLL